MDLQISGEHKRLQQRCQAHGIFKTSPLERLFRDGAIAPIQFPPRDFCLSHLGVLELELDAHEVLPPLKPG